MSAGKARLPPGEQLPRGVQVAPLISDYLSASLLAGTAPRPNFAARGSTPPNSLSKWSLGAPAPAGRERVARACRHGCAPHRPAVDGTRSPNRFSREGSSTSAYRTMPEQKPHSARRAQESFGPEPLEKFLLKKLVSKTTNSSTAKCRAGIRRFQQKSHQERLANPRCPEQLPASPPSQADPGPSPRCVQLRPSTVSHPPPGPRRTEQNQWSKNHPRAKKPTSVRTNHRRAPNSRYRRVTAAIPVPRS